MAVSVEYGMADLDRQSVKSGRLTPLSALLSPRSHFRSAIPRSISRNSNASAAVVSPSPGDFDLPSRSQSRADTISAFDPIYEDRNREANTPSRGSGAISPLRRMFGIGSSGRACGTRPCMYDDTYEDGIAGGSEDPFAQDGACDFDGRRQAYARARAAAARSENVSFDSPTKRSNGLASLLSPSQARQAARATSFDDGASRDQRVPHSASMPIPKGDGRRSLSFDRAGLSVASGLDVTPESDMPPRPYSSLSHMPRPSSPLSMVPRPASSLSQSRSLDNQAGSPFKNSISLVAKNRMDTIHSRPTTAETSRNGSNKSSPNSGGSARSSPQETRRGRRSVSLPVAQQSQLIPLAVPNDPYSQRVIRKRRNGGGTFIEGAGMYRGQGLANPIAGRRARPSSKASTPRSKSKGRLPIPPMPVSSIEAAKLLLQADYRAATPTTSNSGSSISNALQTDLGAPAGQSSGTPSIRSRRASLTPSMSLPAVQQQAPAPASPSPMTHSLSSPEITSAAPAKAVEITRGTITPLEQYELIHRHLGLSRSGSSQGHGAEKAAHAATAETAALENPTSPTMGANDVNHRPISPPTVRPSMPFRRPSDASVTSPIASDLSASYSVRRKPAPKVSSKQERKEQERHQDVMSQIEFDSERVTLKKTLGTEISKAMKDAEEEEGSAQYSPEVPTPPLSPPTPRMAQRQQDHSRRRSSQTSTNSTVPSDPSSASGFGAFAGPEIISMGAGAAFMKLGDGNAFGAKDPQIQFSPAFSFNQNAERRGAGKVPGEWLMHASHQSESAAASDLHDAANFFSMPGSPDASFAALPIPPRSSSRRESRDSTFSLDSNASFQSAEVFEELNREHQASRSTQNNAQSGMTQQLAVTSATSPSDLLALITSLGSNPSAGSAASANTVGGANASSQQNWAVVLPVDTLRALLLENQRMAPLVSHPAAELRRASDASVYSQASSVDHFEDATHADGAELESNILSMLGVDKPSAGQKTRQAERAQRAPAAKQQDSPTPSVATVTPRARSSTSPAASRNRPSPDSLHSAPNSPIPPLPQKSNKRYTTGDTDFEEAARQQIPPSPPPAHASRALPSPSASPASQKLPLTSGMVGAMSDASHDSSPPSSPETFYAALSDDESFVVEAGSKAPVKARSVHKKPFVSSKHLKSLPHNYGYAQ